MNKYCISCVLVCCFFHGSVSSAELTVTIDKIRNSKGKIVFSLYTRASDFNNPGHKEAQFNTLVALPAQEGSLTVSFPSLASGEYAIIAFHDESNNLRLDQKSNGLPLEGVGFSNYKLALTLPTFEQSRFAFDQNKEVEQHIALTYLFLN